MSVLLPLLLLLLLLLLRLWFVATPPLLPAAGLGGLPELVVPVPAAGCSLLISVPAHGRVYLTVRVHTTVRVLHGTYRTGWRVLRCMWRHSIRRTHAAAPGRVRGRCGRIVRLLVCPLNDLWHLQHMHRCTCMCAWLCMLVCTGVHLFT